MGEHAQPLHPVVGEQRPEQRAREAGDDRERCELADQHVLHHVYEEELLLSPGVDRREKRQREQHEAGAKRHTAPRGDRRSALRKRVGTPVVEERRPRDGEERERVERPARQQREVVRAARVSENHAASLGINANTLVV